MRGHGAGGEREQGEGQGLLGCAHADRAPPAPSSTPAQPRNGQRDEDKDEEPGARAGPEPSSVSSAP